MYGSPCVSSSAHGTLELLDIPCGPDNARQMYFYLFVESVDTFAVKIRPLSVERLVQDLRSVLLKPAYMIG